MLQKRCKRTDTRAHCDAQTPQCINIVLHTFCDVHCTCDRIVDCPTQFLCIWIFICQHKMKKRRVSACDRKCRLHSRICALAWVAPSAQYALTGFCCCPYFPYTRHWPFLASALIYFAIHTSLQRSQTKICALPLGALNYFYLNSEHTQCTLYGVCASGFITAHSLYLSCALHLTCITIFITNSTTPYIITPTTSYISPT